LAIFKRPAIKKDDAVLILAACVFPVFFWAFLIFFNGIPSYILQYSLSEIIGIASYSFAFALIESLLYFLVIFVVLYPVALILPQKLFGEHSGPIGALLAIIIGSLFMILQSDYEDVTSLSTRRTLFYLGLIGLGFMIYSVLIMRFPKFERAVRSFFKRFSVLSAIYAFFGILGIVIVVVRNILH